MAWEEVTEVAPSYWKPEKIGDNIEGNIYEINDGNYGKQIVLDMGDDENGEIVTTTLPSHKQLQNFIPKLQVGDYIRVKLVNILPAKVEGRNDTMIYKVQKDPSKFEEYDLI